MASPQTDSAWRQEGLDIGRFEAYAKLLCLRNGGQVEEASTFAEPNTDDDNDDNDHNENGDQFDVSSAKAATLSSFDHEKLKRTFLDRLSELVSGEKGGRQVACCMMVEWPDHVDVLVAKNNAFKGDEACTRLLQELALGLQEISKRGTLDLAFVDGNRLRLWNTVLQLYQTRILHYTTTALALLETIMPAAAADAAAPAELPDIDPALLTSLQLFRQLATNAEHLNTPQDWENALGVAFSILAQRSELGRITSPKNADRLANALGFLSRPRKCYITFVRAAQHMSNFESVQILPASVTTTGPDASQKKRRSSSAEAWSAGKVFESLGLPLDDSTAERVLGNGTKRQSWTRNRLIQRYNSHKPPPTEVHAEVQILLAAQRHNSIGAHVVPYIGCSKRSCLLCAEFVKASGPYATRGCHGKLYSRWTVPPVSWMTSPQRRSLAQSLRHVERAMKKRLLNPAVPERPILHAPESTLGGSSVATLRMQQSRQGQVSRLIEERLSDQRSDAIIRWSKRNSGEDREGHHGDNDSAERTSDLADLSERLPADLGVNNALAQEEENECDVCGCETRSRCTFCGRGRFCGKKCQDKMSFRHLVKCSARPITTADILRDAALKDERPEDPETRRDYGMTRVSHPREESYLLGLYQGLFNVLHVEATEVDKWRRTGVIVDKIIETFHTLPENNRGSYFPWFMRNRHLLDPKTPPVLQEKREMDIFSRALASAQSRLEPPYRDMDWRRMEPLSLRRCFVFYALALESISPNPNSTDDMWYEFGFAVCRHRFEEMRLGSLYGSLFGGNKAQRDTEESLGLGEPLLGGNARRQQRLCPFLEFWKAHESGMLPELFDSYGLGHELGSLRHARLFLSVPLAVSDSGRPPVWRLCQLLALDSTSTESALRFSGAYLQMEAAIQQFGFHPELDARAKVELMGFYMRLLEKADPLEMQAAKDAGQLLELAVELLGGNGVDGSVRKILESI